jgi:hypothetical protein
MPVNMQMQSIEVIEEPTQLMSFGSVIGLDWLPMTAVT